MFNQNPRPVRPGSLSVALGMLLLCLLAGRSPAWGDQILPGHVPPVVARLTAQGVLPPAHRLNLAIGLPLRHAAGLHDYLNRLYDPASPDYHHYLTPGQFTAQFGPTAADYQSVIAFARRHNLTVTRTHGNRLLLDVSGSAADVSAAFHITLKVYRHPTEPRDFYAPDTEPSVPEGLPIADISGLNNYAPPRPRSLRIDSTRAAAQVTPLNGSGLSGRYFGNDFRAAYVPGLTLTGAGQQLGLVEFAGYYARDIATYESKAKLPSVPLENVLLDDSDGSSLDTNANIEVSLDIEMAVAMAPGLSKIIVYQGTLSDYQPNDVLNAIATSNQVSQISSSWAWSGGPSATTDAIFQEMAAQGQSFFNASGDSDAFTTGVNSADAVDDPNQVNAPSSCPYITQVGGTTLTTTGPGGAWSSETVWNWGGGKGSSGGISSYYGIPAWQANVSMAANGGSTAFRNIPDVALTADNILVYAGDGTNYSVGGTSCAAPLWAAVAALMNEQSVTAGRPVIGFVNPSIYALGENAGYGQSFHDITTGSNTWSGSPNNFYAVTGYDLCTGWGTPAGKNLINALAGAPNPLGIVPDTGCTLSGLVGGPFNPAAMHYAVTNQGGVAINWSVSGFPAWLSVTPASGTLAAGGSSVVTARPAASASVLPAGIYAATLAFTNAGSGIGQTRTFTLQVGQSVVQNGGFESGDFLDWTFVGNGVQIQPSGSLLTYNAVEYIGDIPEVVHSGNYGAFLGDTSVATLSQNLATVPGQNYLVSFWLDNPQSGSGQEFFMNWNTNAGNASQIYLLENPPVFAWTNLTWILAATATNTVLQFGAANPPNYFGLDDVSAIPIPPPSIAAAGITRAAFSLTFYTVPGVSYQVQWSTNLFTWTPVSTNTAASWTLSVTNPVATDHERFYRIRRLP